MQPPPRPLRHHPLNTALPVPPKPMPGVRALRQAGVPGVLVPRGSPDRPDLWHHGRQGRRHHPHHGGGEAPRQRAHQVRPGAGGCGGGGGAEGVVEGAEGGVKVPPAQLPRPPTPNTQHASDPSTPPKGQLPRDAGPHLHYQRAARVQGGLGAHQAHAQPAHAQQNPGAAPRARSGGSSPLVLPCPPASPRPHARPSPSAPAAPPPLPLPSHPTPPDLQHRLHRRPSGVGRPREPARLARRPLQGAAAPCRAPWSQGPQGASLKDPISPGRRHKTPNSPLHPDPPRHTPPPPLRARCWTMSAPGPTLRCSTAWSPSCRPRARRSRRCTAAACRRRRSRRARRPRTRRATSRPGAPAASTHPTRSRVLGCMPDPYPA
jgi:hypothetical protein